MFLQIGSVVGLAEIAFILFLVVIVFGFLFAAAYLDHRREMALIEAGAYEQVSDSRAWILAGGLLLTAVGIGSLIQSLLTSGLIGDGLTVALVGLAALLYYWIRHRQSTALTENVDANRSVE